MSPLERLARRRKLRFLRRHGATDQAHSGETDLLGHLESTEALLASWGAPASLRDAALFHSAYGAPSMRALVGADRRDEVRRLIGDEAETLAWLWHDIKRDTLVANLERDETELRVQLRDEREVPITRSQFEGLVNLWFADAVEQLPRRDAASRARQEAWLTPFFGMALPAAVVAARDVFDA